MQEQYFQWGVALFLMTITWFVTEIWRHSNQIKGDRLAAQIILRTKMTKTKTPRGFALIEFVDHNGVACSLQKSSRAFLDMIWLGCDKADPQEFIPGKGWVPVQMPEQYIVNTRMHLTRDMVAALLPSLQHFVDTGELPVSEGGEL